MVEQCSSLSFDKDAVQPQMDQHLISNCSVAPPPHALSDVRVHHPPGVSGIHLPLVPRNCMSEICLPQQIKHILCHSGLLAWDGLILLLFGAGQLHSSCFLGMGPCYLLTCVQESFWRAGTHHGVPSPVLTCQHQGDQDPVSEDAT